MSWFIKAAQLSGFGPGFSHIAHVPWIGKEDKTQLHVTLVRHPCDWLASIYATARNGGFPTNCIGRFSTLDLTSFDAFIRSYLHQIPGGVGGLFGRYKADTYLRTEDLSQAFMELMQSLGVSDQLLDGCKRLPRQNESIELPVWNESLKTQVRDSERKMFDAFDYYI